MQGGKLRELVKLQNPVGAVSTDGQKTFTYASSEVVWASVRNVSQRQTTEGDIQGAGAENYQVRIRYRSGVSYDTRILYGTKVLQVVGIENVAERNRELRLQCELVEQ